MAGGYEFAVSKFGQSAYDAAQEKALNNYMEFEMLDLLQSMGENVNPDEYKQAHDRVVNPN
ncbi:TPA: hypothetical protein N2Y82_004760 [Escherichia coli]|nr:hypothetical protein [Escherichia coli]ELJ0539398.1 hypothetical protein [Escherichia coli O36]EEV5548915.1 hypothetical protein [Escherichia coli]EEY5971496.1 hypothetical protein [Escherichia coli]EFC2153463.1 hypothetical protein [Escherichia coli]EFD1936123.1 hypothetical protein [Escherichia coli]